jgi:hypothetical protein
MDALVVAHLSVARVAEGLVSRGTPLKPMGRRADRPAGHVLVATRDAVIARKERRHPSDQLRISAVDEHRVTAFATRTGGPVT